MTQLQAEAMDAVAHMTAKEIKEFAAMLKIELERKVREMELQQQLKKAKK